MSTTRQPVPRAVARDLLALTPKRRWEPATGLTAESCVAAFAHEIPFTVGAEEELMLVDESTLDVIGHSTAVLDRVDGDARFARELRAAQIEIITRPCTSPADICRELKASRRALI